MAIDVKTPREAIVRTDFLLMAFNTERFLKEKKRVVDLKCGHKAYTGALEHAVCPRCSEMLRRSINHEGEDYLSFRDGQRRDTMAWPDDPCRQFNEPT